MLGVTGNILGVANELGNDGHAFLNRFFISNSNFAYCLDAPFDEFRVDLIDVLLQLFQNWFVVFVVDDSD